MRKKGISKYTVLIPKTVKAVKNTKTRTLKRIQCFFKKASNNIKNVSKSFDKKASKTIHSLSKKKFKN